MNSINEFQNYPLLCKLYLKHFYYINFFSKINKMKQQQKTFFNSSTLSLDTVEELRNINFLSFDFCRSMPKIGIYVFSDSCALALLVSQAAASK